MAVLANAMVINILQYVSTSITVSFPLNLHNIMCPLYSNKAWEKNDGQGFGDLKGHSLGKSLCPSCLFQ